MIFDGRTGMSLTWNDLGLVKKVSLNDTDLVNYSYLADGTKVSALDGDGDGLLYLGSLIYRKQGESLTLESAGFAGGRFVARENADGSVMVPMFHVTDHLGSVRAVVDGISGEVVETNDYYPFGSRWDVATSLKDDTNRFRYNSKEEQFNFGTPYIDYGARQYDPVLGRWFAQDPLSEKYYGISPYAFCAGNPVKYLDPDGEYVETAWDIASLISGVNSFKENAKDGKVVPAIVDGIGIIGDAAAIFFPGIPGGIGAVVTSVRAGDNIVDVVSDVFKNRVKLRKGTKETIINNAQKTKDGQFIDVNTELPIDSGQEVFGHKKGHEWRKYKKDPKNQGKTRKEVIEEQNNPDIYQIEDKKSNASHKYEEK